MNTWTPAEVFPPGEFIREELDARGWTQTDLAEIMGRPLPVLNQIIAGKKAITPETAHELGEAFGTSSELWLNLEMAYRLARSQGPQGAVSRRARLFRIAPLKEMTKRGWITGYTNLDQAEDELRRFLGCHSLDNRTPLEFAARSSGESSGQRRIIQEAWCHRVLRLAETIDVPEFSQPRFSQAVKSLRPLAQKPQDVQQVPRILGSLGVRFVVVEGLPKARIDGATLWLESQNPVIAVSLRYDRIDWFWHTLLHECSHVLHEDANSVDDDLVGSRKEDRVVSSQYEERADSEAANTLIPEADLDSFVTGHRPFISKVAIMQFASLHKVHPGIVVGQLQFRGVVPYAANREMLVPIRNLLAESALVDGWGCVPGSGGEGKRE